MTIRKRKYPREEFARRGREIYERQLRPRFDPVERGRVVAIDIETGDYELGDTPVAASEELLKRLPDARIWYERVGFPAVYRMISFARLAGIACVFFATAAAAGDVPWHRLKLDETFRSEGVAAADVNRDGRVDVIAGDVWYEAPADDPYAAGAGPRWKMREIRPPGKYVPEKGYSRSFCNFAWDINGDGWQDVIVVGFPGAPFHWYENPQNKPGHWKEHLIWHSACNETPLFRDLDGDGRPELILGSQPESQMGYIPLPEPEQAHRKWTFHPISQKGNPAENGSHRYYHGLGVGDVNGDGRTDVLIPHGWWEAPDDFSQRPWKFHADRLARNGKGQPLRAANLHVDDFDLDGDADIVMSSAHAFGVWWFENLGSKAGADRPGVSDAGGVRDASPRFKYHLIDESYSQTHALEYVDINGDGLRDLVTGKRYFAHQGKDPGGTQPVRMYWYEIDRRKGGPRFIRHEIMAGRETGVGTQFVVTDVDGDRRPDIVLSNKKGVNILVQHGREVE